MPLAVAVMIQGFLFCVPAGALWLYRWVILDGGYSVETEKRANLYGVFAMVFSTLAFFTFCAAVWTAVLI